MNKGLVHGGRGRALNHGRADLNSLVSMASFQLVFDYFAAPLFLIN